MDTYAYIHTNAYVLTTQTHSNIHIQTYLYELHTHTYTQKYTYTIKTVEDNYHNLCLFGCMSMRVVVLCPCVYVCVFG